MSDILNRLQTLYSEGWVTEAHLQRWIDSVLPMAEAEDYIVEPLPLDGIKELKHWDSIFDQVPPPQSGKFRLFMIPNQMDSYTEQVINYINQWSDRVRPATPEQVLAFWLQHPEHQEKSIGALGRRITRTNGDTGYMRTMYWWDGIKGLLMNIESGPSAQGREQDYARLWTGHTYFLVEMI